MSGFRFVLDKTTVEQPEGWEDFEEEIIRDENDRIIRVDFPIDLTFFGSGYQYIESKYQESYNSEIKLFVFDNRTNIESLYLRAVIKMSNCTFNISELPKHSVRCEIDDSVYQAAIFQNLRRPVGIGSNESLNGVAITPITPIDLLVYDSITGNNYAETREAYDLKEAFRYAVSFITDGTVNFESDWYDALPDDEKLCILSGAELREPGISGIAPIVTLESLFEETWKKYNLYFLVENPLTNPTLRLEDEAYLYGNSVTLDLKDVEGLRRSMDFEKLYNRIVIGSSDGIQYLGSTEYPMFYLPLLSFSEEKYNITGVINVDRELDLLSNFIIDHNVFVDILNRNDDGYDRDTVLMQYTASTSQATKGTYFPSTNVNNRFYNEQLINSNVAERFNLLGDVVLSTGLLTASFQAGQTVDIIRQGPIAFGFINQVMNTVYTTNAYEFPDDSTPPNFDTGNNYNAATFKYTAPVTGFYRMRFGLGIEVTNFIIQGFGSLALRPRFAFRKNGDEISPQEFLSFSYDGSTIGEIPQSQPNGAGGFGFVISQAIAPGFTRWIEAQQTILLAAGDEVTAKLTVDASIVNTSEPIALFAMRLFNGLYSNPTTPISGGTFVENDPDEYYVGLYEIESIGITAEQWETFKNTPTGIIRIDTGKNDPRKTYLSSIKRKLMTGESDVQTIFNRKQPIK